MRKKFIIHQAYIPRVQGRQQNSSLLDPWVHYVLDKPFCLESILNEHLPFFPLMSQTGLDQSFQQVELRMEKGRSVCVAGGGKCSLGLPDPAYKKMIEGKWFFQIQSQSETSTDTLLLITTVPCSILCHQGYCLFSYLRSL